MNRPSLLPRNHPSANHGVAVRKTPDISSTMLKFWWRFEESDASVDQEFFVWLPDRRAATLLRTENGGFRSCDSSDAAEGGLLVQGTCYASPSEVAELISRWLRTRQSLILVETAEGAGLMYSSAATSELNSPDLIAADIPKLARSNDAPLRLRASELAHTACRTTSRIPRASYQSVCL